LPSAEKKEREIHPKRKHSKDDGLNERKGNQKKGGGGEEKKERESYLVPEGKA